MQRSAMSCVLSLSILSVPVFAPESLFGPKTGLQVERSVESSWTTELESWSVRMNGQDVPSEYLPKLQLLSVDTMNAEVLDEYLESGGGRPLRLRREYSELKAEVVDTMTLDTQAPMVSKRKGSSALEACVVVFDEREVATERRQLEYGECDKALLEALEIDLDFTAFLPPDADAKTWNVPSARFNVFSREFGGVHFVYDVPSEQNYIDEEQLEKNASGEWRLTRGETRTVDGVALAVFGLEGTFESHSELDSELKHVPVAEGPTRESAVHSVEVRGELLWNPSEGRMHGLSLRGESKLEHTTTTVAQSAAGEPVYEQRMHFTGDVTFSIRTETAD